MDDCVCHESISLEVIPDIPHLPLHVPNVPGVPARSVETAHVFKFETPNAGDTGDVMDPASIWDEEPLEVVHSFIMS